MVALAAISWLSLLAGVCIAQQEVEPPAIPAAQKICNQEGASVTCPCQPGQVLSLSLLTLGAGDAETLSISGCSSVTLGLKSLEKLRELVITDTSNVTFEQNVPQLQHLALANISQLTLKGPTFMNASLETIAFDNVHAETVEGGAFVTLRKPRNVSFRNVHFGAVGQNAFQFEMAHESEFTILNSQILGVQQDGIAVGNVTKFEMRYTTLKTAPDGGLRLDATTTLIISDSEVDISGALTLDTSPTGSLWIINNKVHGEALTEVAQRIFSSEAKWNVSGNTFECQCDSQRSQLASFFSSDPKIAAILDSNYCDKGLCSSPVKLLGFTVCHNTTALKEVCDDPTMRPGAAGKASTPAGTAKAEGRAATQPTTAGHTVKPGNNMATAVTIMTALLLTAPAVAALTL